MRIRAVISLFVFSVTAFAADLTWTSLMTVESAMPLPGLPPSNTTIQTMSGSRSAVRIGDNVTIMDGESVFVVDYLKREYYRQYPKEYFVKDDLQRALQNMPGYEKPVIHIKEAKPARPGPTILGIPTILQETGMTIEMKMGPMSMAMDMSTEAAFGKPDGWEAIVEAQRSNPTNSTDVLKAMEGVLGEDALKQLAAQTRMEGLPLRTHMTMKTNMKMGNASLPAMPTLPPMETSMTMEVTSISKTADLTLLSLPNGFREVPPPDPAAALRASQRPAAIPAAK